MCWPLVYIIDVAHCLFRYFQYNQAVHIDDHFCGSEENVGIGSRYSLSAETNMTIRGGDVPTAVHVRLYKDKTVVLVGTAGGHLLQVSTPVCSFMYLLSQSFRNSLICSLTHFFSDVMQSKGAHNY